MNNLHLVCKNLHQIANLYVNPILNFNSELRRSLRVLVQSSRIFEELYFTLSSEKNFKFLENYFRFTGSYVKTLIIRPCNIDQQILLNFLNLFPNLKSLEVDVEIDSPSEEAIKWDLKSRKIEKVTLGSRKGLEGLLESLDKCKIKELDFHFWYKAKPEVLGKFLKTQEKNLKKLHVCERDLNVLDDLVDLRLEELEYSCFDLDRFIGNIQNQVKILKFADFIVGST